MSSNRDLVAASASPIVLAILEQEESHGYAIVQRLRTLYGSLPPWTDAMLYPVLHRLEGHGYVEGRWSTSASGRPRKLYRITSRGRTRISAHCRWC